MSNIEKYQSKLPSINNVELVRSFIPDVEPDDAIELVISFPNEGINVRELSSYLKIIYRVDGFLSDKGLLSYSHNRSDQIAFTNIRLGSVELIIERLLSSVDGQRLVTLFLFLKYLPIAANTVFDLGAKYYSIQLQREELEEKRDKRKLRKHIRDLINEELKNPALDKKMRERLVTILAELYHQNLKELVASSRFVHHHLKKLELRKKKGK